MIKDKNTNVEEFIPMQNFIVVEPIQLEQGEEVTESGLIISMKQNESVTDRPTTGKVLSVGPDVKYVKKDYEIYWPKTDGLDLTFKDGEFMMFKEDSIVGYKVKKN